MEKDQEHHTHRCRICSKSFPCGRSLGGHMRSHMQFYSSDLELKRKLKQSRGQVGLGASYGLRENPKRTWRLLDFAEDDPSSCSSRREQQCRQCCKVFPSWKALFGHMRCHSEKTFRRSPEAKKEQEQDQEDEEEEEEEEGSWNEDKIHLSPESFSDDNEPLSLQTAPSRNLKRAFQVIAAAVSSSSITEYEPEQEDVAISLMMLSRDVGGYSLPPAAESSDKYSVVLENDKFKQSESGDCDYLEEAEFSGNESRRMKNLNSAELGKKRAKLEENEKSKLGSRYQCPSCKKTFHSYQALGGHRASHKRIKGCCLLDNVGGTGSENTSFEHPAAVEESDLGSKKKSRIHECLICGKIFSSGQALGGHKRSHLASSGTEQTSLIQQQAAAGSEVADLLDLNLPAPIDEESSNVNSWWSGDSLKHEQTLVGLISD
ncbi:Zinc finger protein ZAT9 [Apostasia shenzhenica]|uniref:Zinc finger protein ZAT9 n=1 Tax=Apostasia shenzhenica TaxID=1088818 RepID=A0A2I0BDL4_9ASPA|nr:Zinc finger protein ZAT9 [Apostasia shenzhenica]